MRVKRSTRLDWQRKVGKDKCVGMQAAGCRLQELQHELPKGQIVDLVGKDAVRRKRQRLWELFVSDWYR